MQRVQEPEKYLKSSFNSISIFLECMKRLFLMTVADVNIVIVYMVNVEGKEWKTKRMQPLPRRKEDIGKR